VETAVVVGELYRHGNEWKFNAVGSGFKGGLEALCRNYGVNI
ncbi:MAG: TerD family protein, partial [Synergistaceae bacterium]|nr:TerD family protein [Synergistaceae bacterium]